MLGPARVFLPHTACRPSGRPGVKSAVRDPLIRLLGPFLCCDAGYDVEVGSLVSGLFWKGGFSDRF